MKMPETLGQRTQVPVATSLPHSALLPPLAVPVTLLVDSSVASTSTSDALALVTLSRTSTRTRERSPPPAPPLVNDARLDGIELCADALAAGRDNAHDAARICNTSRGAQQSHTRTHRSSRRQQTPSLPTAPFASCNDDACQHNHLSPLQPNPFTSVPPLLATSTTTMADAVPTVPSLLDRKFSDDKSGVDESDLQTMRARCTFSLRLNRNEFEP